MIQKYFGTLHISNKQQALIQILTFPTVFWEDEESRTTLTVLGGVNETQR